MEAVFIDFVDKALDYVAHETGIPEKTTLSFSIVMDGKFVLTNVEIWTNRRDHVSYLSIWGGRPNLAIYDPFIKSHRVTTHRNVSLAWLRLYDPMLTGVRLREEKRLMVPVEELRKMDAFKEEIRAHKPETRRFEVRIVSSETAAIVETIIEPTYK